MTKEGALVLYDVTSTYLEGMACELAKYGYNRDKKKGKTQIIFGLLCDVNGCPIAVEVFEGNIHDNSTIASQIEKVRNRFGVTSLVWVTDRGILTNNKINELVKSVEGLDFITGLKKPQIRELAEQKAIQLGLFDEKNLVEFVSEDYPLERLIACRNPLIAEKNKQQREQLLLKAEEELNKVVMATKREKRTLIGKEKIALRVAKVVNKYKVNKYYNLVIEENTENKYEQVVRALRSKSAQLKDRKKRNEQDYPIHSFRTLLEDFGTICLVEVECNLAVGKSSFQTITQPTRLQQKALNLTEVSLNCTQ